MKRDVGGLLERNEDAERQRILPVEVAAERLDIRGPPFLDPAEVVAQRRELGEHQRDVRHRRSP